MTSKEANYQYDRAIDLIRRIKTEETHEREIDRHKAFDLAISALKKQIPKKPKVLKVHEIPNYKYGECQCGEHIMDDEKYCSSCGQALDWSNSDAE